MYCQPLKRNKEVDQPTSYTINSPRSESFINTKAQGESV